MTIIEAESEYANKVECLEQEAISEHCDKPTLTACNDPKEKRGTPDILRLDSRIDEQFLRGILFLAPENNPYCELLPHISNH